jgi:hypothetical protein
MLPKKVLLQIIFNFINPPLSPKATMPAPLVSCLPWACFSNCFMWSTFTCSWKKYGTTSNHSQHKQKQYKTRWLHKDGCGLFTATMTHFLIYGASYIGTNHLLGPWANRDAYPLSPILYWIFVIFFNTLLSLGAFSHYRAMTTDPGTVPEGSLPLPSDFIQFAKKKVRHFDCCIFLSSPFSFSFFKHCIFTNDTNNRCFYP